MKTATMIMAMLVMTGSLTVLAEDAAAPARQAAAPGTPACGAKGCKAEPDGRAQIMRKAMQWLKEKDAARHDEIVQLRESDKEAFRKAVRDVVKEYLKEHPDEKPQGGPGRRGDTPATPAA